jgi:hypothetical protein
LETNPADLRMGWRLRARHVVEEVLADHGRVG